MVAVRAAAFDSERSTPCPAGTEFTKEEGAAEEEGFTAEDTEGTEEG
jgi:hypothetical protein